jgi:hypothetical protein
LARVAGDRLLEADKPPSPSGSKLDVFFLAGLGLGAPSRVPERIIVSTNGEHT